MSVPLKTVLMISAVVCFGLATFGLATFGIASGRLVPAGLFCWSLASVV